MSFAASARNGWRQPDVARRAGVARETVSRLERGGLGRQPLDVVRTIGATLGVRVDVLVRWRGGDLDRVLNAGHASLHESLARYLGGLEGWTWRPEASYSIWGERGVIDILAWHASRRSLLIIELKTELVDPQELAASIHRRVRLGTTIAREQGCEPTSVSSWLVVRESRSDRRRLERHAGLLRAAFPADGHAVRAWLRQPTGTIAALSFWTDVGPGAASRAPGQRERVRLTKDGRAGGAAEHGDDHSPVPRRRRPAAGAHPCACHPANGS